MNDSRGNWTSASAAEYDALCPGRHLAQLGIPEEPACEAAASGNRIHAALAGEKVVLTTDEQDMMDKCQSIEDEFVTALATISGERLTQFREKRLWYKFGNLEHSGKPDVVYRGGNKAVILDFKTGRNEATANPSNLQLRDLAVLVAHEHGVQEVTVSIVQPFAQKQPPCVYGPSELAISLVNMEDRVAASNNPLSPRIPGNVQCEYCRAKHKCPEFAAAALPIAITSDYGLQAQADVAIAIRGLSSERLGAFLAISRLASDTAEQEVRERLQAGTEVQGWSFKPGRTTEKVTNPQEAFNRFIETGGTSEQFLQTVTVGKTKLKDALRAVTAEKGKVLDANMERLLFGITEEKTSAPILTHE